MQVLRPRSSEFAESVNPSSSTIGPNLDSLDGVVALLAIPVTLPRLNYGPQEVEIRALVERMRRLTVGEARVRHAKHARRRHAT